MAFDMGLMVKSGFGGVWQVGSGRLREVGLWGFVLGEGFGLDSSSTTGR